MCRPWASAVNECFAGGYAGAAQWTAPKEVPVIRVLTLALSLAPAAAIAQSDMMHEHHMMMMGQHMAPPSHSAPAQAGQAAFAAIQEVVDILEADPKTDWSKVNIDALREHLVDMNNVVLSATVRSEPIAGGMRFDVTGEGPVRDSIRRMTKAHAAMMNGADGWTFEAADIDGGAALTARAPAKDQDKPRGLGFFGLLALGMHHGLHHLTIARARTRTGEHRASQIVCRKPLC